MGLPTAQAWACGRRVRVAACAATHRETPLPGARFVRYRRRRNTGKRGYGLQYARDSMSELEHFEMVGDHAVFRPTGEVSLLQAIQMVTAAIAFAREQHVRKLMVVTSGLTGFEPPSLAARYFFIHEWARAAGGSVRVAVVAKPEMIDPQKFGVTVAATSGLIGDVFASEDEAIAWLQIVGAD